MFGSTNQTNNYSALIANTDKNLLDWITSMHSALNRDKLNLREVGGLVEALKHLSDDAKDGYINTLLYPETIIGMKIPTLFPIPSTTFQFHLVGPTIPTNSSGNMAWTWNPAYLQDSSAAVNSTFYVNNNVGLTGSSSNAFFLANDIGYAQLPANIYGSYRLISASMVVTYIGRMDIVSGVIGAGIGINNAGVAAPGLSATPANDANSAVFGNFLQIDNLFFKERTQSANGCRSIYFPTDDRYTNFLPVFNGTAGTPGNAIANTYVSGFYFAGYAQGLPISTANLRFDFYLNFEALVTPQYANFIPTSTINSSGVDAIQSASLLTTDKKELIVSSNADIPGTDNMNISAGNLINKMIKQANNQEELPSVEIIRKMINKHY
jgi:hypothetical protein